MSEIIEKTYELLDTLDKSKIIKKLTYYKKIISNNKEILLLIKKINNIDNQEEKIKLKQELYKTDYKNYIDAYNELFYIVLKINNKYKEYTNTKE